MDELLTRLCRPPGAAGFDEQGRRYLLDRLISTASRHEVAEELTFWPAVRGRATGGGDLADEGLRMERDAKAILDLLPHIGDDVEFRAKCSELRTLAGEHARFEEDTVFPELARHTTRLWSSLAELRFRAAARGGPTRPHPDGPDRPLSLLSRGAPTVVADHVRDLLGRDRAHRAGFDNPAAPSAIEVIEADHARITELLRRVDSQDDPDDVLVHTLLRELAAHDSIERRYLYPAVRRRVQDGNSRYQQLITEHGRMTRLAAKVDAYRRHDPARLDWINELVVDTRTHMEQEERTVLSALAARLTDEELVELGSKLTAAQAKAPSRPHPLMPREQAEEPL